MARNQASGVHRWHQAARLGLSGDVARRSLRIALLVGASLSLINQGKVLHQGWAALNLPKFLLNFMVPYLVATYSAVDTRLAAEGEKEFKP